MTPHTSLLLVSESCGDQVLFIFGSVSFGLKLFYVFEELILLHLSIIVF